MRLNLNKSICFIDLETTGVQVATDRIVEISILKIEPSGEKITKTELINPQKPIPKEASDVHGIYDKDVKEQPTFPEMAYKIAQFIGNSDLGGFNSNKFDFPLLAEEFLRADVDFNMQNRKMIDVQNIFHKMEQRTLQAAYIFYCKKEIEKAHSAEADILATYEVLEAQLDKYDSLENDVAFLHDFSQRNKTADLMGRIIFNKNDEEVFNFGKHKGKTVSSILKNEPSYYDWVMRSDFPLYTKKILTAIRLRELNQ